MRAASALLYQKTDVNTLLSQITMSIETKIELPTYCTYICLMCALTERYVIVALAKVRYLLRVPKAAISTSALKFVLLLLDTVIG